MRKALVAFLFVACLVPVSATPAPMYRLTDLGIVDGYSSSFGYGLSDDGRYVSGWLEGSGGTRAFRWSQDRGMEVLPLEPGMPGSRAFGVNDSGVVAGESVLSPTRREATLWNSGTARQGLGTLPNPSNPNSSSVAFGVNDDGVAVGWSDADEGTRAFRWTAADGMTSVGVLPGGTQSRAYAVNADGDVVGWGTSPNGDRGFIASPGVTSVGTLSATPDSRTRAFGVSNNGWVTGDANDPALGEVAFAWSAASGIIPLGLLAGSLRSFGADINSRAIAVGWNDGPLGEEAFLWTADDGMISLNELLLNASGWDVQRTRSINDLSYIAGNALGPDGRLHAVLLTPVSEPPVFGLLALALAVLAIGRRAKRPSAAAVMR